VYPYYSLCAECTLTYSLCAKFTLTYSLCAECNLTYSLLECTLTFSLCAECTITYSLCLECTITFSLFVQSVSSPVLFVRRAFGKTRQWEELAGLAKSKKSAIGFGPFVDVCIEAGVPAEANRYLKTELTDKQIQSLDLK
jgi:hypothetical protein